jgi:sortase A
MPNRRLDRGAYVWGWSIWLGSALINRGRCIPGTALTPGSGNIGIAAHRDTYIRTLRAIRANDVIALKTPAGTSRYAVTDARIVRPSDVGVLACAPGRDLTLVTCYPFFYVGSAPERFIVHARKIG